MSRQHAVGGLAVAGLALVATAGAADRDPLVAEGERWWSSSGDAQRPVACATCHHDPDETRGWAVSFPKFKPLPPANAEAVERHYGHADPRPAATAITAYLAAQSAGLPPTPGLLPGQPAFPARLRALDESVTRGGRLYGRRCAACHAAAAVAPALAVFPRSRGGGESLEGFLQDHAGIPKGFTWDSPAMADVLAYLATEWARRPPSSRAEKESP